MKILIIYPYNPKYEEPITGGQLYDHFFIDRIMTHSNYTVDFLTDDKLCLSNKKLFNFAYLQKFSIVKQYDIVLTNSRRYTHLLLLSSFLKLFSKTKLISIHHHFDFLAETNILKSKVRKLIELHFLNYSYATIIPNLYIKEIFHQLLPNRKVIFVESAIKRFPHDTTFQNKNNNINLLFVGTVEQRKGLIYLIKSLGLLSKHDVSFHCNIVGKIVDKKYHELLKIEVNKLNLEDKISFRGRVSDDELTAYYNQATCFVFPSLQEGYGYVIMEAMAFGLPVIAFDNSAMPYTVKNGMNGMLAKDKDFEDFERCMLEIINNKPFREQLSKGALETYEHSRTYDDLSNDIKLLCQSNFGITKK